MKRENLQSNLLFQIKIFSNIIGMTYLELLQDLNSEERIYEKARLQGSMLSFCFSIVYTKHEFILLSTWILNWVLIILGLN